MSVFLNSNLRLLAVCLVCGCSADLGLEDPNGSQDSALQDAGVIDFGQPDAGCETGAEGCPLPTALEARCAFLDALPYACTDLDGDCHPESCDGPLVEGLDCDDRRADVHPSAEDICDAADNDCDGQTDEALNVGTECDNGCGTGKVECSVQILGATACSTDADQSQSMVREEICNGLDDDCDGQVDEICRLDWPILGGELSGLAAANGDVAVIIDGALWRVSAGQFDRLSEGPAAWPSLSGAGTTWLEPGAEGCPERDDTPGVICPGAQLKVQPLAGTQRSAGIGDFGVPVAHGDSIWWHAVLADGPVMQRAQFSAEGLDLPHGRLPLTDPAPVGDDLLGALEWAETRAIPVARRSDGEIELGGSGGRPGPMVLSETWAVWPTDGGTGLWAVELGARVGVQIVANDGPHRAPRLAGESTVVWLRGVGLETTIEALDLVSGARWTLASGDVRPGGLAVSGRTVYFVSHGPSVGVFRAEVPGG